jgi:drug/metabolite transporter superfamily protein YnfA
MKNILPIALRVVGTFVAFCALQYIIPYYLLALAGIVGGFFMLQTSNDRPLALGILIGSIVFAVFAYVMAQVYPM